MSVTTVFFGITAILLYLWVAFRLGKRLAKGALSAEGKRLPIAVGMGAMTLHGLVVYVTLFTAAGVNLSFFNAVSLVSWLVVLLLLATAISKPVENLGIALLPLAAVALALSLLFPADNVVLTEEKIGLDLHILISILAFSVLNIATIQALLLALQNKQLRDKKPGGFIRGLPPLETMERLLFQMIGLGFVLQTLSLLSGFFFVEDLFAQHLVHKTVLAITAWIVYAVLLWGRFRFGWRGRVAIRWTVGGFVSLLLAYVGSKLVLELVLNR